MNLENYRMLLSGIANENFKKHKKKNILIFNTEEREPEEDNNINLPLNDFGRFISSPEVLNNIEFLKNNFEDKGTDYNLETFNTSLDFLASFTS